jgi:arylsulfatase A-like enzyme
MLMISRTAVIAQSGSVGSPDEDSVTNRPGFNSILLLSAWCGLVAGLLEVGMIGLRKQFYEQNQLYKISRHFVWLTPLSNLVVFLALGLLGYGIIRFWPNLGRRVFDRILGTVTILPLLVVSFPRIYSLALLLVAAGISSRVVPILERSARRSRRFVQATFVVLIAITAILGTSLWASDWIKERRERARPLPPPGSPNVLLVVLDSVTAGHLSLHGYSRATSPTLVELAERGIRFDAARSPSSWTLPSHASMFTGRWMHELSVGWFTPLDQTYPTLAEFLGERGFATAGFVANTYYCAANSGLGRGFTRYQDFIFPELTALKTAMLVDRAREGLRAIVYFTRDRLDRFGLLPWVERLVQSLDDDRKDAEAVNRELLDWLSTRAQPARPFFAFLNYYDAHYAYELPRGRIHRFGIEPTDDFQRTLIQQWGTLDKTTVSPAGVAFAADAYDDCIADLDERLGKLIDELDRLRILEQTWLIITSDHGESFGEHAGVFGHGVSLYDTELRVPLLIVPPRGAATTQAVKTAVSLRDLAATVSDVAGQNAGSPFPGETLARFWTERAPGPASQPVSASSSFAEVVPAGPRTQDDSGATSKRAPLAAIKENEWSYIRREGDGHEELFHLSEDMNEQQNLASDPSAQTTLQRMRAALDRLTGGPLVPERFGR